MTSTTLQRLRSSASYIWILGIAIYFSVLSVHAVVKNYESKQELDSLQQRLEDLTLERNRQEALLIYYKSDAYKEKELRRTQLLARADERVYSLPESSGSNLNQISLTAQNTEEAAPVIEQPVWKQWVEYFF